MEGKWLEGTCVTEGKKVAGRSWLGERKRRVGEARKKREEGSNYVRR